MATSAVTIPNQLALTSMLEVGEFYLMLGYPGLLKETDTTSFDQQLWFKGYVWVTSFDSQVPIRVRSPTNLNPTGPKWGNQAQTEP